jgi:hypothetical protein
MQSADADATTPPDPERIPLEPIPTPPAPEVPLTPPPGMALLDLLLVLGMVAFAFVVASFRAMNSDVYLHLAVGRLIAQGQYPFGEDPFTFGASGWINHAWLYSLGLYLLHRLADGPALVVAKAILVASSALLLFFAGKRPGERAWIPVMCVVLAVLTMSPRLLLSPLVVSIVALSSVLLFLLRHQPGGRAIYLIPLICFVWVNTDHWFFLGPLAVLLFLLGEVFAGGTQVRTYGIVFAGSLLFCCVNPYHVLAFTAFPPELLRTGAAAELARDPMISGWHLSVFEPAYFSPNVGLSVAGQAYFLLIVVGIASFAMVFPRVDLPRAVVFVAFLLLSLLGYRLIPFFAVVAAPIVALNFIDGASRRFGPEAYLEPPWRFWAVTGRLLSVLLLLAGILASIPGWLQGLPHVNRRFDFALEVDEGLKAAALRVDELRKQGALEPGQRWANLGVEPVAYFAWFCPGEKFMIDHRIGNYPLEVVRDFLKLRRSLQGEDLPQREPEQAPPPPAWREIMKIHKINSIAFHALHFERQMPTLQRLYSGEKEWTAIYVGGRTSLFAWREPQSEQTLDRRAIFPFDGLAFGPEAIQIESAEPLPLSFLDALTNEARPAPAATYTAQQHLVRFEVEGDRMRQDNERVFWGLFAARQVGTWADPLSLPGTSMVWVGEQFFVLNQVRGNLLTSLDNGPASSAYLAVRAAREAIRLNPQDYRGYMALAQATQSLHQLTRERSRTGGLMPHVPIIRQSQILWALREALRLEPTPLVRQQLHWLSIQALQTEGSGNYLDQSIEHQAQFAKLARELRSFPLADPEKAEEALKEFEKNVRAAERELEKRRDEYVVQSARLPAAQKANKALSLGLSKEAIKVLAGAKPDDLASSGGAQLLVSLYLALGMTDEARERLTPTEGVRFDPRQFGQHPLGLPAYDWFRVQLAATLGQYELADEALEDLDRLLLPRQEQVTQGVGDALLSAARQSYFGPQLLLPPPFHWGFRLTAANEGSVQIREQAAVLATLRAWLALETGHTAQAGKLIQQVDDLATLSRAADGKTVQVLEFRCLPLAQLIQRRLQQANGQP